MGDGTVQNRLEMVGESLAEAVRSWRIEPPEPRSQKVRGSVVSTTLTYQANAVDGVLVIDNPPRT